MKNLLLTIAFASLSSLAVAQVSFTTESIPTNFTDRGVVDLNGDFLDDVVSISTSNVQVFYQQPDGTFVEQNISTTTADNEPSWSFSVGDYDGNGYNDLLYGGGSGVTFMQANADGTEYTEISYPEYVFSQRSNFVDINNDGHLDAFVCHDVEPNVYYINDGSGNLTFIQGGIGDYPTGGHYGSVWIDFDNDGDMDMFNAKCNVGGDLNERSENELHENDGAGNFVEIGFEAGLEDQMQTWSSAWADFDNDGYMDVFVGSSAGGAPHKLMINNGDGTFSDISASSGVQDLAATGIENCTYDFNNDGWADIATNGNILLNNGDLTFSIVSNVLSSNNGSFGDLNNDGFIDAFTGSTIFYNEGNDNHWITINTVGVESNRNAIGARIKITSDLGTQIREVRSGEGFRYMSTLNTHFGLGADTQISTIEITWPSGTVDTLEDVEVDQVITVEEGETILGLEDAMVNSLIIHPNPTQGLLHLSNLEDFQPANYSIFDLQGKRVMHSELLNETLDVSRLANGTYILKVTDGQTSKTQKFIKY